MSPTAQSAAQTAEGAIVIHKRLFDATSSNWKPATPAHGWAFNVANSGGVSIATPTDEDNTKLEGSLTYTVTEILPTGFELFDFRVSSSGGAACPGNPIGGSFSVTLTAADFTNGTVHLCAYNRAASSPVPAATATPTVAATATPTVAAPRGIVKEFFSDTGTHIVWKLSPLTADEYFVLDSESSSCQAFNGADCGAIASGGYGRFASNAAGQYLLVSQGYVIQDGTCTVINNATWASGGQGAQVQASFRCSGATALGWPLLGIAVIAASTIAYFAHRRRPWVR